MTVYLSTNSIVARADDRRAALQAFSFCNARIMSSSEKMLSSRVSSSKIEGSHNTFKKKVGMCAENGTS